MSRWTTHDMPYAYDRLYYEIKILLVTHMQYVYEGE